MRTDKQQLEKKANEQRSANQSSHKTSVVLSPSGNGAHDEAQLLVNFTILAKLPNTETSPVQTLMRKAIVLLRSCGYPFQDVCVILAHASVYYNDAMAINGREMDPQEMAHVLIALTFLAHSYVEDNTCPLSVWHQRFCKDYCTLKLLNTAVMQLMKMRHWILRVGENEVALRLNFLQGCGSPVPSQIKSPTWQPAQEPSPALAPVVPKNESGGRSPCVPTGISTSCTTRPSAAAGGAPGVVTSASARKNVMSASDRKQDSSILSLQTRRCSGPAASAVVPPMPSFGGSLGIAGACRGWQEHLQPTTAVTSVSRTSYLATYASLHTRSQCPTISCSTISGPTRLWGSSLGAPRGVSGGRLATQQVVCM